MRGRQPDVSGRLLAEAVPAGETLYLFRVKDEGLLFYYGRPVRRLADPLLLPSTSEPVYCIVTEQEFPQLQDRADIVRRVTDSQGETVLLIKTEPRP